MRILTTLFCLVLLTACSTPRVAVVPAGSAELNLFPTLITGTIQDSSIEPNYTFQENYLQPTPSVTQKGWKGNLIVAVTTVDRGDYPQATVNINRAFFTNPYRLPDLPMHFALTPREPIRLALDKDNCPQAIVPVSFTDNR